MTSEPTAGRAGHVVATPVNPITRLSVEHPWWVIALVILATVVFAVQFPKIKTDTDPKNMLPITSPVRQYNNQVEGWFALHPDVIVLGIRNEDGIFAAGTLRRIGTITEATLKIPGVIAPDVISLPTVDDVTAEGDTLRAQPLLAEVPATPEQMAAFKRRLLTNPLLVPRLLSADGKMSALYIPIEKNANGKEIADQIKQLVSQEQGPERFYLAGDPVARDTFGAGMFRQMALFSPLAGALMVVVLFLMFRNWTLVFANMAVAMVSIIWSMGLFIGLGIPIHIMASMGPVFLMAISTDTVHIFNEFYFRFQEVGRKGEAILATMGAVGMPILFSDLTATAGFASLGIGPIIPVRIFGFLVAFGTLVILLMSFTLVPALMALMREEKLTRLASREHGQASLSAAGLEKIGRLSLRWNKAVVLLGAVLVVVSIMGVARIRINNNMISWFREKSAVRTADRMLNENLGGTATLYLVASAGHEDVMKDPAVLRSLQDLQRYLESKPLVGKTLSMADYVKRVNRIFHGDDPSYDTIPESKTAIAQYLLLLNMGVQPRDLNNVVDYPYQKANVIAQLRSWDAVETKALLHDVERYLTAHPLPGIELKPAGIAYFNMVWNHEVLVGMLSGFIASSILVFFLLVLDYRSFKWGLVSFIPLLFTVLLIYGFVGFVGKDFDMPISVLSTLSLGLAVDFAIHFVSRFQQRYKETRELSAALRWTVARPGKGILRNALLFACGFSVMIFAQLTPYITVGVFMIAIMLLSAAATIVLLPALVSLAARW
ncbi:MAG: MMPL family transporter, partial [Acidobacteria bacterium]|nr:MMPL family transporter [Acidobacteriota bacterium]